MKDVTVLVAIVHVLLKTVNLKVLSRHLYVEISPTDIHVSGKLYNVQ